MKKSNIEVLKSWINSRPGIKAAAAEPQAPTLNSKQRNYLKWQQKINS